MFNNLLASIEADINRLATEQDKRPHDIQIATRRLELKKLAMDYIKLENQYREISGLNSVY